LQWVIIAPVRSIAERFWEKVEQTDDCWLWNANLDGYGYGRFRLGEKKERSHRVSWELAFGPIPEGLHVLHKCDTPACVRPDHLFLGDRFANMRDASHKGRMRGSVKGRKGAGAKGEANKSARLTESQVGEIRQSEESQRALGRRYGVSQAAISKIKARKSWAHVI
jgi:hypothetical protein